MLYEDMNPKPRKKAKNNFGKNIFKLVNKSVFRKNMKNFGKHRDIKLVTIDKRRNQMESETNNNETLLRNSAWDCNKQKKCQYIQNC